jgi:hypothetical protein
LGNFKAEKAVYQMLPWCQGHYVMTFKDVSVKDEITVSNLGLLLQGYKRIRQRQGYIDALPALETVFEKTNIFLQVMKKKSINNEATRFISLFDGKRSLARIISESPYDDIKTLERITKLYQQRFIQSRQGNLTRESDIVSKFDEITEAPKADTSGKIARPSPRSYPHDPLQALAHDDAKDELSQEEANIPDDYETASEPNGQSEELYDLEQSLAAFHADKREKNEDEPALSFKDDGIEPVQLHDESEAEQTATAAEPESESESEKESEKESESAFNLPAPFSQESMQPPANDLPADHTALDDIQLPASDPPANLTAATLAMEFETLFEARNIQRGSFVVVCADTTLRKQLITTLTDDTFSQKEIGAGHFFEHGKLMTPGKRHVEIFGVSTEGRYLALLQQLPTLAAYVVLIESHQTTRFGYLSYLLDHLKDQLAAPGLLAVSLSNEQHAPPIEVIRYALNLSAADPIAEVNGADEPSVREMLQMLCKSKTHPVSMHMEKTSQGSNA